MRVLLWHGYLLSGSGSNLYTSNVVRIWRRRGHDVLLMCQERHTDAFPFVDEHGDFAPGNEVFQTVPTDAPPAAGRLRLARPHIGEILPVYVYDEYEGFTAKRFVEMTDDELARYTNANIAALVTAIEEHGPDAIITGHEVMGPYIARQACGRTSTTYVAKLHGSALEYAVKEQARYKRYAGEGLNAARVVTGGSNYMIREASSVVPGWEHRAVVVNPGCDVDLFVPRQREPGEAPRIGYVGKYIASKGVHHLLAALGLTTVSRPEVVMIGYGGFEAGLHQLWTALRTRDVSLVREIAVRGEIGSLRSLLEFIDAGRMDDGYFERIAEVSLQWLGRLEHDSLARVLPTLDVLVVPSVLAEAFGMVAAEAAACGVLPVVPRHSGIGEVGEAVERAIGAPGLLTFDPADPVTGIADRIDSVLQLPFQHRQELGAKAAALARERWSWEHVAERLLELAGPIGPPRSPSTSV